MHYPPVMVFYGFGDEVEIVAQAPMRRIFIVTGEPTVAGHIGIQDGGELAG